MAAFYRYYSGRPSQPNQPTDADQENNNVEAAGAVPAEEDLVADIQDGAALVVEIQLQDAEELVAGVQEEVALAVEMQLDRILRRAPHSWSPLERLAVNQWAGHQAQL